MAPTIDELVSDALTTVRLVPRWQLPAATWPGVHAALTDLGEAIASGDPPAIHRSLEELEAHGPTRLTLIGRGSAPHAGREAPPRAVLDLVNRLVHPEGGWTTESASPRAGPASPR